MFRHIRNRRLIGSFSCCQSRESIWLCQNSPFHVLRAIFNSPSRITLIVLIVVLYFYYVFNVGGMKQRFGKYEYAFNRETILEVRSSRFHNITVAQYGSLRMLRFDMFGVEAVVHLEHPYLPLLDYIPLQLLYLLWNAEPKRVLVIGLGAGIMPRILQHLSSGTQIDIVEIDAAIIDIARKHFYFYFNENNLMRIFHEDGRHFVERQRSNLYDVIIVDAFTTYGRIPHALRTLECLGEFIRVLKSPGIVVTNFLHDHQESRYRETYARALFKQIYQATTKENYVFIALSNPTAVLRFDELRVKARGLQQIKHLVDVDWLEQVARIQDVNEDRWNRSAAIFTDQVHED